MGWADAFFLSSFLFFLPPFFVLFRPPLIQVPAPALVPKVRKLHPIEVFDGPTAKTLATVGASL